MLLGSWRRPLRGMARSLPEAGPIRNYLIVTVLTLSARGSSLREYELRHGERRGRPPAVHMPAALERGEPRGPHRERLAHPPAHGRRVQVEGRARRPECERPGLVVIYEPLPRHGVRSGPAWVAVEVEEHAHEDRQH